MAIENLYASSLVSGSVATGANAVGAPNGTYTTNTGNTNWTGLWELDNPVNSPSTPQTVTVTIRARRSASGGSGNPQILSVTLLDGGTTIAADTTTAPIISTFDTTTNYTFTIPSASYPSDGSALRVALDVLGHGGGPNARTVQIDSIQVALDTEVAATIHPGSGAGSLAFTGSGSGVRTRFGGGAGSVAITGTASGTTLTPAIYYVKATGSDAADGLSDGTAWGTIAKVNAQTFIPGDTILFNRGDTWRDLLTIPTSGDATQPITFGAYGTGDKPIISAMNVVTGWDEVAGGAVLVDSMTDHSFNFFNFGRDASNYWRVTEWAAPETFDVTEVKAWMAQVGSVTGNVWLEIYDDDGAGAPGSLITNGTSATIDASTVSTSGELLTFTFATPPTLTSGSTYYFVAKFSWTLSTTNYMQWRGRNTATDPDFNHWRIYSGGTEEDMAVDGGHIEIFKAGATNQWEAALTTDPLLVIVDRDYGLEEASAAAVNAVDEWHWAANVLTIYATADPDIGMTVEYPARNYACDLNGKSYVTFEDIRFEGARLYVCFASAAATDNIFTNCDFYWGHEYGFLTQSASLQTNFIHTDCYSQENGCRGIQYNNNNTGHLIDGWHSFRDACSPRTAGENFFGGGIKISGSRTSDLISNLIIENSLVEYCGVRRDGTRVSTSKGFGFWSDLIVCTPGNENIWRNNIAHDNAVAGFFCEKTDYSIWHHFLSYDNWQYGLIVGAPFDPDGPISQENKFYHFTLVGNGAGGSVHEGNLYVRGGYSPGSTSVLVNNIFRNFITEDSLNHEAVWRDGGENDGTNGAGNVYEYLSLGAEYTAFVEFGAAVTYNTYAALETAYGADLHEVTSAITFDTGYLLAAASPAIDAGVVIAGINDGYNGVAPDLGWAETVSVIRNISGSGTIAVVGSATATPWHFGVGSGSVEFTGSATGTHIRIITGSGTIALAGSATGEPTRHGSGAGSVVFSGAASGLRVATGAAAGTVIFTGSATGTPTRYGAGTGTVTFTGTATGSASGVLSGAGSGSVVFTGSATGTPTHFSSATGTVIFSGTATGPAPPPSAAIHLWDRIASPATTSSTSFVTFQTITAAELAAAGFVNNDEVLILWFFRGRQDTGTNQGKHSILYNSTEMMWDTTNPHYIHPGTTGRERIGFFMERFDLATLADIELRHASTVGGATVWSTVHSEVFVIRLSDFGTENTDWFWNKNTTAAAHTTSFADRASITWTPGSVEDWVYLSQMHIAFDTQFNAMEAQVLLDGAFHSGHVLQEGITATEELSYVHPGVITSLAASAHTLKLQTRDDASAANDHRNSRFLLFRKAQWPSLFIDIAGTVAVAANTDDSVAAITDSIGSEQAVVLLGHALALPQTANIAPHIWAEQVTTTLPPEADTASGNATAYTEASDDELQLSWMGYLAAESGVQDLSLWVRNATGAVRDFEEVTFVVWGLGPTSGPPIETGSGAGTVVFTGTATGTVTRLGSAAGTIVFTGTGTGTPTHFASAAGTAEFTGTATGILTRYGAATATVTFTGVGSGTRTAYGVATGSVVFSGTATGLRVAKGAAAGTIVFTGSASGTRTRYSTATGSVVFTGTGTGTPTHYASGSATVVFTTQAQGFVYGVASGYGTVVFTGSGTGSRTAMGAATGTVEFSGAVAGTRTTYGAANGSVVFSGTASGTRTAYGVGSGIIVFTGTADGTRTVYGSGSASVVFNGSATGVRTRYGAASGSVVFSGTASGTGTTPVVYGAGSGSVVFTGTASGVRTVSGTGTGTVIFTGTVTGLRVAAGSGSGTVEFTGSASGTRTRYGAAAGTVAFTGAAQGFIYGVAAGYGTVIFSGTATGTRSTFGAGAGTITFSGEASGTRIVSGSASGSVVFTGTSSGTATRYGAGIGTVVFTGTATGTQEGFNFGEGSGAVEFTGTATGLATRYGTGAGTVVFSGEGTGTRTVYGAGTGTVVFTATATGARRHTGEGSGVVTFTTTATGVRVGVGSGTSTITFTSTATGLRTAMASAAGTIVFTGYAIYTGDLINVHVGIARDMDRNERDMRGAGRVMRHSSSDKRDMR